jgi:hypothetical protein
MYKQKEEKQRENYEWGVNIGEFRDGKKFHFSARTVRYLLWRNAEGSPQVLARLVSQGLESCA